jgi:hypothetical protein
MYPCSFNKSKYKIDNSSSQKINVSSSQIDNLLKQIRLKNKSIKEQQAPTTTNYDYKRRFNNQKESKIDINILLGRKVNNLSKNKFKFVKKRVKSSSFVEQAMKLDNRFKKRRKIVLNKSPFIFMKRSYSSRLIKESNVISIKGVKYNLNKSGKKLKRLRMKPNKFKLDNKLIVLARGQKVLEKCIARWVLFKF